MGGVVDFGAITVGVDVDGFCAGIVIGEIDFGAGNSWDIGFGAINMGVFGFDIVAMGVFGFDSISFDAISFEITCFVSVIGFGKACAGFAIGFVPD